MNPRAKLGILGGMAFASCLPQAIAASARGNPLWLLLGAMVGLICTTLPGCRKKRSQVRRVTIMPDPLAFDARMVADGIASSLAQVRSSGQGMSLCLAAVQCDRRRWLCYEVFLDVVRGHVDVVANVGGGPGSAATVACRRASASLPTGIRMTAPARLHVKGKAVHVDLVPEAGDVVLWRCLDEGRGPAGGGVTGVWTGTLLGLLLINLVVPSLEPTAGILPLARLLAGTGMAMLVVGQIALQLRKNGLRFPAIGGRYDPNP